MRTVLVILLAGLTAAAVTPARAADPPRAADLEAELVCPACKTTLDQSSAPVAERMKLFIRQRIAAGDSEQEIKDALVADFGPGVLARPPKGGFGLLAWLLPLLVLGVGAAVLAWLVRTWTRRDDGAPDTVRLDPELESRVDEALARFDG